MRLFSPSVAVIVVGCAGFGSAGAAQSALAAEKPASKIFSAEDGWVDVSAFLNESYGFLPIAMPITEPAVGYGLGGGLAFLDKPLGEAKTEFARPNITAVFGFGTENGTWGGGVGDMRSWFENRLQTLAAGFRASVNLDFYGLGDDPVLRDDPLRYNLDVLGGVVQGKYQIGESRFLAGIGFVYTTVDVSFEAPDTTPELPDFTSENTLGGLLPSLTYDTRDNIFTPTTGLYVEASAALFDEMLGSDDDFQRAQIIAMYFHPLSSRLFLGVRGQAAASSSDAPFYLRPYIMLRGAPAMRYQGDQIAQVEGELRWQFWKRFSLVGFAGTGGAWSDSTTVDRDHSVVTGGTGFRYEIAREYGIHAGLDVAFGPDETAIYVQVGSAWMRP